MNLTDKRRFKHIHVHCIINAMNSYKLGIAALSDNEIKLAVIRGNRIQKLFDIEFTKIPLTIDEVQECLEVMKELTEKGFTQ